jgi:hypothetical protein
MPMSKNPTIFRSDVTVSVGGRNVADVTAYVAAIALAGAAAWFSIRGMVVLFPGAPMSVVGMAIAMEGAKLVTAGWLARRWQATGWIWRLVLVALVAGLAIINAAGVYAQLVAAHVGERGAAASAMETQDASLAARIEVAAHVVDDLDRRLGQIDTAIETAADAGALPSTTMNLRPAMVTVISCPPRHLKSSIVARTILCLGEGCTSSIAHAWWAGCPNRVDAVEKVEN